MNDNIIFLCMLLILPLIVMESAVIRITVVGAGSWGTAVAKKVAENAHKNGANEIIRLWVRDEKVNGHSLTETINSIHENVKYLPNVKLPKTIVACSDMHAACDGADLLLLVVPHQYLVGVLRELKHSVKPSAIAVSLIKGISFDAEQSRPLLLSDLIRRELQLDRIAVLMGANVASDVADDKTYAEATVASADIEIARSVAELFDSDNFRMQLSTDVSTVELCGALKNVIALGAGNY